MEASPSALETFTTDNFASSPYRPWQGPFFAMADPARYEAYDAFHLSHGGVRATQKGLLCR